jgi:DNA topoisomerase-1
MKLVIVESPSKAKTINKYLGKDYIVVASYGHIRQLPSKNGSVKPEENFTMIWEETTQAKKHLTEITKNVKSADEIYLATDPDREGEAISWHILSYLKDKKLLKNNIPVFRVLFNSITKENILKSFENPRKIDDNLVSAYMARLALDYLVGFNISPVLWRKLPGSRSAGRVQSVALKIVCERENEIDSFISAEYWSVATNLNTKENISILAKLVKYNNEVVEKFTINNEETANSIKKEILKNNFILSEIENKKLSKNPYPPFTTSSLQQDAFHKLGFSAKKTMQIAQKLYEGFKLNNDIVGLITYMRTDATQINPDFIKDIRTYIQNEYGKNYLSNSIRDYKTKAKNAQEAHEAIRPTSMEHTPSMVKKYLEDDFYKLYDLIYKRTLASQMQSASYDLVVYHLKNPKEDIGLRASGSILTFDGFYKIYKDENEENDENKLLPKIELNSKLNVSNVDLKQHFSEPPARYSEATLVKKLEEIGIGRPSTYASIISVLQDRQYVVIDKKRLVPQARGRILNVFLNQYFSKYVEYDFTANLEKSLDEISNGDKDWRKVLQEFWESFHATVKETEKISILDVLQKINEATLKHFVGENTTCQKCGNGMLAIKTSKFGAFIGCSNYPTCNYTHQLESYDNDNAEQSQSNNDNYNLLGVDNNGVNISIKKGPYGLYLEREEEKPKRISIPSTLAVADITLDKAIFLLSLPKKLDDEISFNIGKFGPYLQKGKEFFSYKGDIFAIDAKIAKDTIESLISKKIGKNLGKYPNTKLDIVIKSGRYGEYIFYNKTNIKIPKQYKNKELNLNQAIEIINDAQPDKKES